MFTIVSWIHLIAAIFWVGGMLFLSLVAVPVVKACPDPGQAQRWFLMTARRFRSFVWMAIAILILTGMVLLPLHVSFSHPVSEWPVILFIKLMFVILLILTSVAHDRIIGPRVRLIKQRPSAEWTNGDRVVVQISPWIGRMTMLLGMAVVFAGVALVRS